MAPKAETIQQPPTEALRPDQSLSDDFLRSLPDDLKAEFHIIDDDESLRVFARDDLGKVLKRAVRNEIINRAYGFGPEDDGAAAEQGSLNLVEIALRESNEMLASENEGLRRDLGALTSEKARIADDNLRLTREAGTLRAEQSELSRTQEEMQAQIVELQRNAGPSSDEVQSMIADAEERVRAEAERQRQTDAAEAQRRIEAIEAQRQEDAIEAQRLIDEAVVQARLEAEAAVEQRIQTLEDENTAMRAQLAQGAANAPAPVQPEAAAALQTLGAAREKYLEKVVGSERRAFTVPFIGRYTKRKMNKARAEYEAAHEAYGQSIEGLDIAPDHDENNELLDSLYQKRLLATGQYTLNQETGQLDEKERKVLGSRWLGKRADSLHDWYAHASTFKKIAWFGGGGLALGLLGATVGAGAGVMAGLVAAGRTAKAFMAQYLNRGEQNSGTFAANRLEELINKIAHNTDKSALDHIAEQSKSERRRNKINTLATVTALGGGALAGAGILHLAGFHSPVEVNASRVRVPAFIGALNPRQYDWSTLDWNPFNGNTNWLPDRKAVPLFHGNGFGSVLGEANIGVGEAPVVPVDQPLHSHDILHGFDRHADIGRGSGYVHEIHDMFQQNGYNGFSLNEAEELYNASEGKFDGQYLRHTGSYWRGPDWGIDSPGQDAFRRNVAQFLVQKAMEEDMIDLKVA